ncbi:hypothetical protein D9M69_582280 [compost metagenome]
MLLHELFRLHEHPARSAARVVDATSERLQHFNQHTHYGARGIELAATLAFGSGELAEEIFVHAPKDVLGSVAFLVERNAGDQVDQLAQHHLVERGAGVVLGQHTLERLVVLLNGAHRVVDQSADRGQLGVGLQVRPASLLRHPEHVVREVLVLVLGGLGVFRQ